MAINLGAGINFDFGDSQQKVDALTKGVNALANSFSGLGKKFDSAVQSISNGLGSLNGSMTQFTTFVNGMNGAAQRLVQTFGLVKNSANDASKAVNGFTKAFTNLGTTAVSSRATVTKVFGSALSSTTPFVTAINQLNGMLNTMTALSAQATQNLGTGFQQVTQIVTQLQNQMLLLNLTNRRPSAGGNNVGGNGVSLLQALAGAQVINQVRQLTDGFITAREEAEKFRNVIIGLGGDEKEVAAISANFSKYIASGFKLQDLEQVADKFKSLNLDIVSNTDLVVKLAARTGQSLQQEAALIARLNTGQASLRLFTNAGFTRDELKKSGLDFDNKGKLQGSGPADIANRINALTNAVNDNGQGDKLLELNANSLTGSFGVLSEKIEELKRTFGEILEPTIVSVNKTLGRFADGLTAVIKGLSDADKNGLAEFIIGLTGLGAVLTALAPAIFSITQIGNVLSAAGKSATAFGAVSSVLVEVAIPATALLATMLSIERVFNALKGAKITPSAFIHGGKFISDGSDELHDQNKDSASTSGMYQHALDNGGDPASSNISQAFTSAQSRVTENTNLIPSAIPGAEGHYAGGTLADAQAAVSEMSDITIDIKKKQGPKSKQYLKALQQLSDAQDAVIKRAQYEADKAKAAIGDEGAARSILSNVPLFGLLLGHQEDKDDAAKDKSLLDANKSLQSAKQDKTSTDLLIKGISGKSDSDKKKNTYEYTTAQYDKELASVEHKAKMGEITAAEELKILQHLQNQVKVTKVLNDNLKLRQSLDEKTLAVQKKERDDRLELLKEERSRLSSAGQLTPKSKLRLDKAEGNILAEDQSEEGKRKFEALRSQYIADNQAVKDASNQRAADMIRIDKGEYAARRIELYKFDNELENRDLTAVQRAKLRSRKMLEIDIAERTERLKIAQEQQNRLQQIQEGKDVLSLKTAEFGRSQGLGGNSNVKADRAKVESDKEKQINSKAWFEEKAATDAAALNPLLLVGLPARIDAIKAEAQQKIAELREAMREENIRQDEEDAHRANEAAIKSVEIQLKSYQLKEKILKDKYTQTPTDQTAEKMKDNLVKQYQAEKDILEKKRDDELSNGKLTKDEQDNVKKAFANDLLDLQLKTTEAAKALTAEIQKQADIKNKALGKFSMGGIYKSYEEISKAVDGEDGNGIDSLENRKARLAKEDEDAQAKAILARAGINPALKDQTINSTGNKNNNAGFTIGNVIAQSAMKNVFHDSVGALEGGAFSEKDKANSNEASWRRHVEPKKTGQIVGETTITVIIKEPDGSTQKKVASAPLKSQIIGQNQDGFNNGERGRPA